MRLHPFTLATLGLLATVFGSSPARGDSTLVRSPTHSVSVPYQPEALHLPVAQIREVVLFYTQDNGRTWLPGGRVRPDVDWFDFKAPGDGDYQFTVQVVDRAGHLHPPARGQNLPRMRFDTQPPKLELDAWMTPGGEAVVRWSAYDAELMPASVELKFLNVEGENRWRRFDHDAREPHDGHRTLVGQARGAVGGDPRGVVIRLTASDRTGNQTQRETRLRSETNRHVTPLQLTGGGFEISTGSVFDEPLPNQAPAGRYDGSPHGFDVLPPLSVAQNGPALTGQPVSRSRATPEGFEPLGPAPGEPPAPLRPVEGPPRLRAQADPLDEPPADPRRQPMAEEIPMPERPPMPGVEDLPDPMAVNREDLEDNLDRNILLRAARNAVANRQFREAAARYEELLDQFPTDAVGRAEYAGILIEPLNRIDEAIGQFQILMEQDPDRTEYLRGLVDVYLQGRRFDDAIALLSQALERNPESMTLAVQLARVYGFAERFQEGYHIYQQFLAERDTRDTEVLLALAPVLLLLQRPDEALPMFEELLTRELPEEADAPDQTRLLVMVNTIRNYHALGNQREVLRLVQELMRVRPQDLEARLSLGLPVIEPGFGNALVAAESRDPGLIVYSQVLSQDPTNLTARLGSAHIYLQSYEVNRARAILAGIRPEELVENPADERLYNLILARYHTLVGEFPDGVAIYNRLLANNSRDVLARTRLGDLWYDAGEHGKAKATYTRALALEPRSAAIRFRLARNDWLHRYFHDAEHQLAELLTEDRWNMEAFRLMMDVLVDSGQYGKAEDLARSVRPRAESDVRVRYEKRLALAKVYRHTGRPTEAIYEAQAGLRLPYGPKPHLLFEYYMAVNKLQGKHKAKDVVSAEVGKYTDPTYALVILSRLGMRECQDELAIDLMNHGIALAPDNLLLKVTLGQAMQGHPSWNDKARGMYSAVVGASPTNIPARLGLARTHSLMKDFGASADEYGAILTNFPTSTIAHRERARLVSNRLGCERSCKEWNQAIENAKRGEPFIPARPAEGDLLGLGGQTMQAGSMMGLTSDANGLPVFAPVLGEGAPEPPPVLFSGDNREAVAAATERKARCLQLHRPGQSIPLWEGLIDMEPAQPSHYFDLGQSHAFRNNTYGAMDAYKRQLEIDPCAREASIALNRSWLELRPRVSFDYNYFFQRGRDGLADIYTNRIGMTFTMPIGNEDEYVSGGYHHYVLTPTDDRPLSGDILSAGIRTRVFDDWLYYFGNFNVEIYPDRRQNRPTFVTGLQLRTHNDGWFTIGGQLENVDQNGEALRQDIFRGGYMIGYEFDPHWRWHTRFFHHYNEYSDNNSMWSINWDNTFRIWLPPRQWDVLLNYNFWTYRNETEFAIPDNPLGATHPYFAPQGYSQVALLNQWKHWLSHDYFKGACETWYRIASGGMIDSDAEAFGVLQAEFRHDVYNWLSVGVDSEFVTSNVYRKAAVWGYMMVRFR